MTAPGRRRGDRAVGRSVMSGKRASRSPAEGSRAREGGSPEARASAGRAGKARGSPSSSGEGRGRGAKREAKDVEPLMTPGVAWPVAAHAPAHMSQYFHGLALAHAQIAAQVAVAQVASRKINAMPMGFASGEHAMLHAGAPLSGVSASDLPGRAPQIAEDAAQKKMRRKESNRESARRSRLRKQAETADLGAKVKELMAENAKLREEVKKLRKRLKMPSE